MPLQRTSKPSALKKEHPALPKMKCINFFLCLRVIFGLLDSDPDPESGTLLRYLVVILRTFSSC